MRTMAPSKLTARPAEPERYDLRVGASQPCASTWSWERAYTGPPEDGQPRAGSAVPPVGPSRDEGGAAGTVPMPPEKRSDSGTGGGPRDRLEDGYINGHGRRRLPMS
jgi:hypothetical protein